MAEASSAWIKGAGGNRVLDFRSGRDTVDRTDLDIAFADMEIAERPDRAAIDQDEGRPILLGDTGPV